MMVYQEIAAGVSMPMLGFGTFLNTGKDCARTVAEAIRAGYRLIDTAEAYGNEEQVGNGIKRSGIDRRELLSIPVKQWKILCGYWGRITSIWCCCTGLLPITMPHGGYWRRSVRKENCVRSAYPILRRIVWLT